VALGLILTAAAALSPGYWWFVVIFAAGRPLLSATNAVAQVCGAELTGSEDRAKAMGLVAAGYGIGAGVIAIVHSLGIGHIGFRAIFALALFPLALMPWLRRWVKEPDRFAVGSLDDNPIPILGAVGPRFRRRLTIIALQAFGLSVITGPATGFAFLYAQNFLHLSGGVTAAAVVGAGVMGLLGLIAGARLADHIGRRPTCTLGMVGLAGAGILTYAGTSAELIAGYILGVTAASVLAPAVGALVNEVFPTSVRASVMGWWVAAGVLGAAVGLVVFGAVADVGNKFEIAALVTFLPAAALAGLFWLVPETRGRELEQLWAEVGERG
jgi:putative MFS transporter